MLGEKLAHRWHSVRCPAKHGVGLRCVPGFAAVGFALPCIPVAVNEVEIEVGIAELVEGVVEPVAVKDIEVDVERIVLQTGQSHGKDHAVASTGFKGKAQWMQVCGFAFLLLDVGDFHAREDVVLLTVVFEHIFGIFQCLVTVVGQPGVE